MPNRLHDLSGQVLGQLTVLRRAPSRAGKTFWACICSCTPEREVEIRSDVLLREGRPRSCGCLKRSNAGTFERKPDDEIGYLAAHERVYRERGPARDHPCSDCGGEAIDWALRREARGKMAEPSGPFAGHPYSPDPDDYQPMCRPCHSRYDRTSPAELRISKKACNVVLARDTATPGGSHAGSHSPPRHRRG